MEWTLRLLLEEQLHEWSVFVTLTYDPIAYNGIDLVKRDLILFLKRLRKIHKNKIRYFAVGEYGETYGRPHYHLVIFGVDIKSIAGHIDEAWDLGITETAILTPERAAYTVGYTVKKYSKERNIGGDEPEFSTMSRRPGIGYGYIKKLGQVISKRVIKDGEILLDRIPTHIKTQGKLLPLDNYMTTKLLDYVCCNEWAELPSDMSKAIIQDRKQVVEQIKNEYYDKSQTNDKFRRINRKKGNL